MIDKVAKTVDDITRNMKDADALCYVPVQKMTVAVAMLVASRYCKMCGNDACGECEVRTLSEKLKDAIGLEPIFDEDFNLIVPAGAKRGKGGKA